MVIKRKILVATTNPGKIAEIKAILDANIEWVRLSDFANVSKVKEAGATFAENARKKAVGYAKAAGLWTIADDSGLVVDALGGKHDIIEHLTCSPNGKRLAFPRCPPSSQTSELSRVTPQLFVVDVDGTNLRQVTFNDDGNLYYPKWSPDGKHIAFEFGPSGGIKTLTIVSVDDGTIREVFRGDTPQDRFFPASWSPDGSRIVWGHADDKREEIRIGQVSNGKYSTFKVPLDGPSGARWSPDGTKMLFATWVNVEQLMIMDSFLPAEK